MIAIAILSGCDQGPPPTVPLPPPPVSLSPGGGGPPRSASPAPTAPAAAPTNPEAAAPAKTPADQPAPITDSNLAPGKIELPAGFDPAQVPAEPTAEGAAPAADASPKAADPIRSGKGLELPPAAPDSSQLETKPPYRFVAAPFAPLQETANAKSVGVTLKASAWPEIAKAVAKTGKVTVVDLWSLACEPCLKEFPGLVKLHRELGDKIACASVNLDFDGRKTKPAESYRPRAEAFLASVKATFPNYLSTTASDEVFGEVGIDSIPAVMVFDANGKLIRTFSDVGDDAGFTYDKNVIPFVQGAVAKSQ
jgi:thiol-disulfide isomerase/thioredoxin